MRPSYATVARWVTLFKNGRESIEDDPAQAAQLQALLKTTLKPLVRLSWKTLIQLITKLKPLHPSLGHYKQYYTRTSKAS